MPTSILLLKDNGQAYAFSKKLQESSIPVVSIELVEPSNTSFDKKEMLLEEDSNLLIKRVSINDVQLLNPKLAQKTRQKKMSLWLMPFGLVAGITFSGMTNLETFSRLGLGSIGEIVIGGLLGLGSGWIGSLFAASSVNPYKQDIESLRKKNEQGKWILILKTPFESELPWAIIKEINPIEVLRLNEL